MNSCEQSSRFQTTTDQINKRKAYMSKIRSSIQAIPLRRQNTVIFKQTLTSLSDSVDLNGSSRSISPGDKEGQYLQDYSVFETKFELLNKLGEGTDGVVYRCKNRQTQAQFAVKSFSFEEENLPSLKANFLVIKSLHHPNIIKYEAFYVDTRKRMGWLVMELVNSPSLEKTFIKSEEDIKKLMLQLMNALSYLHERDIVHRDIKPENILYDPQTKTVKLVDFGISKRFRRRGALMQMWTITGTLYYRAPEMFAGGYREPVDVWAAGVLLYQLVTGRTPFEHEYHNQTIQNIRNGEYSFSSEFGKYSRQLKFIVGKMLQKSAQERSSASACLEDSWFSSLKFFQSRKQFSISDKDIVLELNSQGYAHRKSKKVKKQNRKQSLDGVLLAEYFPNTVQSETNWVFNLILPSVQQINGQDYYCIEPLWKNTA